MKQMLRGLFEVVQKVKGDQFLVLYCLAHLDGILEDDRERAEHFITLSQDYKNPMPVIKVLNDYIFQNSSHELLPHRDIASHVLSLLIE